MQGANLENEPQFEEHQTWEVSFDDQGKIQGLPEGIESKDVIVFLGPNGEWLAQNPSPELLKEIQLWRSDWNEEV